MAEEAKKDKGIVDYARDSFGLLIDIGEVAVKKEHAKLDAAAAQYSVDQTKNPVGTNGAPVRGSGLFVDNSYLVIGGLLVAAVVAVAVVVKVAD